jgi:hypothetical protein
MAKKTASIAKISRPVLTGNYPRKRLFRLIDRARKRKLLWISGPAGSGKTTLVSSYIAARRIPCMWYRLEEGDADPATFFHYLGLAARKAAPRIRKPLPALAPEQRSAVSLFAQRYFEALFSRLPAGSMIVFDDYQKVPDASGFHSMIRDGLSLLLPRGHRLEGTSFVLRGDGRDRATPLEREAESAACQESAEQDGRVGRRTRAPDGEDRTGTVRAQKAGTGQPPGDLRLPGGGDL